MGIRRTLANKVAAIIDPTVNNSASVPLGRQFWKYGNSNPMIADWSDVMMNDKDLYTGYMYAALRNRANRVASVAREYVRTTANRQIMDASKAKNEAIIHPYLQKIIDSNDFSNRDFWYRISTWADLKGAFWLMAVRNVQGTRVGDIQYFKLLNPFNIQRVISMETGEVEGYKETRGPWSRNIPKELVIEMWDFHPLDDNQPFAMAQAAKEARFTQKQAGDYTRSSLRNNVKNKGIVSTNIELSPEQMANFKASILNGNKSEPIFTDGAGNVKYDPMQVDMDKAALDKINNISLEELLAVTGMSRTTFGIEVSGVTRDTSKVQYEQLVEGHTKPRIEWVIDALNQDFKRYYPDQAKKTKYEITLENPFGIDRDAEIKDNEVRTKNYELFKTLVNAGYKPEIASKYAAGEISLEELGEPTNPPVQLTVQQGEQPPAPQPEEDKKQQQAHHHDIPAAVHNQLDAPNASALKLQEASLKNAIINVEHNLVAAAIGHVSNAYDSEKDIIGETEKAKAVNDLETVLTIFYGTVLPLYGSLIMNRRIGELGYSGTFTLDPQAQSYIRVTATRAAQSHVSTVVDDLLKTAHDAFDAVVADRAKRLEPSPNRSPEEALAEARRLVLDEGAGHDEIVRALRQEYTEIAKNRAEVIAKSEANRAFTASQYEADRQFLDQNGLTGRAFKKLITRSASPCQFCLNMAAQPPIPFDQNFANLGEVLSATFEKQDGTTSVRKMKVDYEEIRAGNLHPLCECTYLLIVE